MRQKGIPLKKSLLVNLAAGVVLLGVCLLTISLVATNRAVGRLSGALTNRVISTTDAELLGFFEPVQSAIAITAERTLDGEFEAFPLDQLDRYFEPLVERMPQISSVMYSHEDGDEYMLLQTNDAWRSRQTRPDRWGPVELMRVWSAEFSDERAERRELNYDARTRPWHAGALELYRRFGDDAPLRERIYWTAPYKFFTTQEPGVTASFAQRIDSGRVVVIAFDILLADISRFTSQLAIGERGLAFVLRGEPTQPTELVVVGLPADERFEDPAELIRFVLSPPHELGGPVASFISAGLVSDPELVGRAIEFDHNGESWWGEIARSRLRTSDNIWVGAVLPESELLEGLPDTSLIVAVTTGLVLVLAIFRATWLARRYATPLEQLTDRGNRMQRLNFEPVEPVDSDITEIRHLSATLERMRGALQEFSAAREDLRVARSIRELALPAALPPMAGMDLAVWQESSEELGGECYDIVVGPDSSGVDRSTRSVFVALFEFPGKGVMAAVNGSQLLAAFRSCARSESSLPGIARRLDVFCRSDRPALGPLRMTLARIDPAACLVSVVAFGQEALVCRQGGEVEPISGAAAGLGLSIEPVFAEPENVALQPGDLIVFASSGILDALDSSRTRFGHAGIANILSRHPSDSAAEIVARIRKAVKLHAAGLADDRTLLVLRLLP